MRTGKTILKKKEEEDCDNFEFELLGTEKTILLEASDRSDLHYWQRGFHFCSKGITSFQEEECPIYQGYLSFPGQNNQFYFTLNNYSLKWYESETCSNDLNTIPIENCSFHSAIDESSTNSLGFIIQLPNNKDLTLIANSVEDKKMWLQQLVKAKFIYWKNPHSFSAANFSNRGFLMKLSSNKHRSRLWFTINNHLLLYYKSPEVYSFFYTLSY